jgi:hypothetical protein
MKFLRNVPKVRRKRRRKRNIGEVDLLMLIKVLMFLGFP